ncbi:DUF2069 domain-containing protein [Halomonas sp. MCCC 1A17488]|uniref:DUF2069 domain-containing protein n=1 Tax=Billgrantia sulfidoxydans TaxID=2733484 RepID=A0ABX7W437_9GAMM|nr:MULTISPECIES: DUF2069 domain-containing protein [Halomonas]MCE8015149.1 DUF2069 domain-containing protein [Halomonas sp. MCCC 1A17488]MCG3238482.1 DUF2069 domain-containing protein [Halomonas sp. MCCC 1A17488]QPP47777.1 DUF2069 domain-containing protein [Halomonas sp. SS10-MC5]QTP55084.1 DUF2069 domain-containing protein [Halomonas sulfidoxydans]
MRRWVEGLETRHGLDMLTERSRQLVLTSYVLLLVLLVWSGLAMQAGTHPLTPILIRALPLILFLPSILGKRARGHAWLAFVSLLYFVQGVMVATLPGQGALGVAEALVALALFTGCMFYARFRSRQIKAARDA